MKKYLIILVVCGVVLVVPTFADTSTPTCAPGTSGSKCALRQEMKKEIDVIKTGYKQAITAVKETITGKRQTVQINRKEFKANFENVSKYLKKPLTGDLKTNVQTIIKQKNDALHQLHVQTLALVKSGTVDWTGYVQQGVDIVTSFQSVMMPYIDVNQTVAFSNYIQAIISLIQTNTPLRQAIVADKKELQSLSGDFKAKIDEKKQEIRALSGQVKAKNPPKKNK